MHDKLLLVGNLGLLRDTFHINLMQYQRNQNSQNFVQNQVICHLIYYEQGTKHPSSHHQSIDQELADEHCEDHQ